MATRANEKDGKNRQTQHDRQGHDDATRRPEPGAAGTADIAPWSDPVLSRWERSTRCLGLMPKLCLGGTASPSPGTGAQARLPVESAMTQILGLLIAVVPSTKDTSATKR